MKKALVLCGTVPHTLLIEKLKARGYYTLVADMNPGAPAVPAADEFVCISAFDKDAISDYAKKNDIDLVISSCSEQANLVCCYVGEKLGLPHPYSYETALDVTNKGRMKRLFKAGNVTTSDFRLYKSVEDVKSCDLSFPLVVKPVDAYSSKGVHRADSMDGLLAYAKEALDISFSHEIIVEGYCPGVEIQVDCVAIDGKAHVIMTRSKRTLKQSEIELNSSGSRVPADISEDEKAQAQTLAQRIADAFGLKNTPFFYQARLNEGVISVLEFAPRIGGGLSFQMIKRATGVDIVELSINSFTGEELSLEGMYPACRQLATLIMYAETGVFGEVTGLSELINNGTVDYAAVLKKRGDAIKPDRTSSNRVLTLIVSAESVEQLESKLSAAENGIDILDIDGKSVKAE